MTVNCSNRDCDNRDRDTVIFETVTVNVTRDCNCNCSTSARWNRRCNVM